MKETVRGVSIHYSASGLQYYVHYDKEGTELVSEREYYQAVYWLEQLKTKIGESRSEKRKILKMELSNSV